MKNTMAFPIVNVSMSIEEWADYENIWYDKYLYTREDSVFNEYCKEMLFCDCHGFIYKAVGKAEPEAWRNWFWFLPNVWKVEVIFEPTGKQMSIEELREFLLVRVSVLEKTDLIDRWITLLHQAVTHRELIDG